MKKKSSRKALVKRLDDMVSRYIRDRDEFCVVCGSKEKLTNGHLFSRVAYSTRWDETNCNCQCWGCNFNHEFDPQPYTSWFIRKYGVEKYDELHRLHRTPVKIKDFQLEEMITVYQHKILALNKDRALIPF